MAPVHLYVSCLAGAATGVITAEGVCGCPSRQVVDEWADVHTLWTQHSTPALGWLAAANSAKLGVLG
jgi:hypothetical protein